VSEQPRSAALLITGSSGAGKTSWCQQLVTQLRASGVRVAGLLSPPVWINGRKTAIDLLDLVTGERRCLASVRQKDDSGLVTTHWQFDPDVLAWGDGLLQTLPPCDALFLDELGPLEFEQGLGLQTGLTLLDGRSVPRTYAVVRPRFLDLARQRWPWAEVVDVGNGRFPGAQP
jgi:nucleoside-triphosphatase